MSQTIAQAAPAAPSKTTRRRLDIDLLKAIGCFTVVLYHLRGAPLSVNGISSPAGYYLSAIMSMCVPIFFITSGALYAHRDMMIKNALAKAGYLLFLTLFWAFATSGLFALTTGDVSLDEILVAAVTLQNKIANHLWFLPALATAYLAAPVLIAVRKSDERLWNGLVALILVFVFGLGSLTHVCGAIGYAIGSEFISKLVHLIARFDVIAENHPEAIAYFALGMWLDGRELPRRAYQLAPLALFGAPLVLSGFGLLVSQMTGETYDVTWEGIQSCTTAVMLTGLYLIARHWAAYRDGRRPVDRLITLIACNSFSVYVLHWLVRPTLFALIPRNVMFLETFAMASALTVVAVLASAAIGSVLRRTPLRTLFAA